MQHSLESPLRRFISLQQEKLLVLGARRIPPLPCPGSNTDTALSIVTSVGFAKLESTEYVEAVQKLRPDIVLSMGDVVIGQKPSQKREEKMGDRTQVWVKELADGLRDMNGEMPQTAIFAPILPLEAEQQLFYLSDLKDELKQDISGLVLYEARSVTAIPEDLLHLPRLSIENLESPHDVLSNVALGIDLFTLPFIGVATDAGIALNFTFPLETSMKFEEILPLGIDMWSPAHAVDLSPLRQGCNCYACLNHHRAYLQHLLGAKEMLGWVLLQTHNHQIIEEFLKEYERACRKDPFPTTESCLQNPMSLIYQQERDKVQGRSSTLSLLIAASSSNFIGSGVINSSRRVKGNLVRMWSPIDHWTITRRSLKRLLQTLIETLSI